MTNLKIVLLLFGYFGWSGGSTYWYVCKIKNLCPEEASSVAPIAEPIVDTASKVIQPTTNYKAEINEHFDASFNIKFKSGSTEYLPDPELEDFLKRMSEFLNQHPDKILTIIGHTDNVGDEKKNYQLGLGRAESVKKTIVKDGAKAAIITSDSKGETSPIADNETTEGRETNRRVDFKIN